jgi:hypothetical protein
MVVIFPILPIIMRKFPFSVEGASTFASSLGENVLGIFVEVIDCIIEHGSWRTGLERLKSQIFIND